MIRKNTDVIHVAKALLINGGSLIILMSILGKSLISANFALLALLVWEHMLCMKEAMLDVGVKTINSIPYFLI